MFDNQSKALSMIFCCVLSVSSAAPGLLRKQVFPSNFSFPGFAKEELEREVMNQLEKVWGQECMVDRQCASVMVLDMEIQISVCDSNKRFLGNKFF